MTDTAVNTAKFAAGILGLIGAAGHYLVIRAYHDGPAVIAVLGYLIFDNFPDVWTWVGAAIIIACGLYIALRERRLRGAGR